MPAGGSVEVRFDAAGRSIGRARIRMTVKLADETDAFQDVIPVEVLVSPETVSAIGEADDANPTAAERLKLPAGVVTTFGGLHVDLASTALVGLGEGARYLVEYPYGCAEQRGSRALALLLAADLGEAFKLPGHRAGAVARDRAVGAARARTLPVRAAAASPTGRAPARACPRTSRRTCSTSSRSPSDLKYAGRRRRCWSAPTAISRPSSRRSRRRNEGWWPSYTAWQAFAVKVLVEGGRKQDSHLTRLYGYRDRMPVFALAYLNDALVAKGEGGGVRSTELKRRIANAILPEAATAHVEEIERSRTSSGSGTRTSARRRSR